MSLGVKKPVAGHTKGHSNKERWTKHQILKEEAKRVSRLQGRLECRQV